MANPMAGEVDVCVGGQHIAAKLTLGALAELEAALDADGLFALVERFEQGKFRSRDVLSVIAAGLRGGGWAGRAEDLLTVDIGGGPITAARVAAELLARAFRLP